MTTNLLSTCLPIFQIGLLPSAGRGRDALGLDNSGGALLPTEPPTDPRLNSRPVRSDATRTAYSGWCDEQVMNLARMSARTYVTHYLRSIRAAELDEGVPPVAGS